MVLVMLWISAINSLSLSLFMVFQDKRVVIFGLPVSYFFDFFCIFVQLGVIHFLIILLWKSMYPSDGEHYKEFLYKQKIHKWWLKLTSLFIFWDWRVWFHEYLILFWKLKLNIVQMFGIKAWLLLLLYLIWQKWWSLLMWDLMSLWLK